LRRKELELNRDASSSNRPAPWRDLLRGNSAKGYATEQAPNFGTTIAALGERLCG
jgi:hypothetical protein